VTPETFGAQLRRYREKRKVTLDQVAQQTKVSASLLRSLEAGQCSRWPGGIYSRGYMRSYALAIGLDPERAVELFSHCYPQLVAEEFPEPEPAAQGSSQSPLERIRAALAEWLKSSTNGRH